MVSRIILLVALVGGAGLIAYTGDLLGRRMGKARLTLLGLRPRHTAILVTVLTGMAIAAITVGLILAADKNLRKAIIKGNLIIAQNQRLLHDNEMLESQRAGLERDVRQAERSATEARKAESQARRARDTARFALAGAQRDLSALRNRAAVLDRQIRRQQADLREAQGNLESARRELQAAQQERDRLDRQIAGMRKQIEEYELQLASAERQLSNAERILRDLEQQVADRQRLLEQAVAMGRKGYTELRMAPVIYAAGEEVYRTVVQPVEAVAEAENEVVEVLDLASVEAEERGAVESDSGRAVVIAPAVIITEGAGPPERFTEQDSIRAIAEELVEDQVAVVMQVLARGNSIAGEPTTVEVRLYRNAPAFSEGDVLACRDFNASDSADHLSAAIREFIGGPVREAARSAGIIPRIRENGEQAYFEMDVDRLAGLVAEIRAEGGVVRVCARAAVEIRSAGPLTLRFDAQERRLGG